MIDDRAVHVPKVRALNGVTGEMLSALIVFDGIPVVGADELGPA